MCKTICTYECSCLRIDYMHDDLKTTRYFSMIVVCCNIFVQYFWTLYSSLFHALKILLWIQIPLRVCNPELEFNEHRDPFFLCLNGLHWLILCHRRVFRLDYLGSRTSNIHLLSKAFRTSF